MGSLYSDRASCTTSMSNGSRERFKAAVFYCKSGDIKALTTSVFENYTFCAFQYCVS